MPKSVVDAYAERARLSVHPLAGRFARVRTLLAWRRDVPQGKVAALQDMLDAAARTHEPRPGAGLRRSRPGTAPARRAGRP